MAAIEGAIDPISLCGICFSESNDCKMLPCQHIFCETCLQNLLLVQSDGTFVLGCPTCQHPITLPSDGTIGLPTVEQRPMTTNQRTNDMKSNDIPVCSRHNKKIQLFCETCEQVTCHMCAIEDHQEHQYYILTRNLSQHKTEITTGLEQVKKVRETCIDSLTKIREREEAIEKQSEYIKEEIESLSERLVDLIRTSEKHLLTQLEETKEQKLNTLTLQKKENELALVGLLKCCESLENSLSIVSPQHFLANKKMMAEMINKFTTRSLNFEPAEKADLKFKGNGSLLVLNKSLGHIQHSLLYQFCKPINQPSFIRAGTNTFIEVQLQDYDETPITSLTPSLFTCKLHPPDSEATPTECSVEELQPGIYGISITPIRDGIHQLSILVGGQPIHNSPFNIPVAPTLTTKGQNLQIVPNFQHPWGVASSPNGELVVIAETTSHCVHVLKSSGKKVKSIGSKGKEDGCFTDPRGVAFTSTNHILVTDYNRIQKLTLNGQCVRSICGRGSGPLQFQDPKGVAVHPITGKIFIADSNNHRIQVLNSDCTFSHSFGGGAQTDLGFPWDVTCDKEGFVYVVDNENHTVNKFTTEGKFVSKFGSKGSESGQLNWPSAISYGTEGHLYVTDDNHRVSIFTTSGKFVRKIELHDDSLNHPIGIAVNELGKVFISDCWNNRLVII